MPKRYKEAILGVTTIILSVFSWWCLKNIFYRENLSLNFWILAFVVFIFWGIALSLAMLLIKDKKILYGSFIVMAGAFGMFFNNEPFYYLIGLVILFCAFIIGAAKIKREEEIQVKLNFYRIWKRGLPIFVTALALLIAMVYYFSPALDKLDKKEIIIPRNTFDMIIAPFESLIKARLPQESPDLNVKAVDFLKPQEISDLKDKYNIVITKDESIRDLLYQFTEYQINSVDAPYEKFIPIGLAITLFLALKFIGLFYVLAVILFTWLFLRLLIVLKFASFNKETKEVETVRL